MDYLKDEYGAGYKSTYRSILGGLLWISVSTRPDIAFAVIQVAKFVCKPSLTAFRAVTRIVRYLKGTRIYGLRYSICVQHDRRVL